MKLGHTPCAFGAILAVCGLLAPIASANLLDWNVNDGSFNSASSWVRNPSDTNPPDSDGIPDSNDNVIFSRGGGSSYMVTFPGRNVLQPPADYFSATTALGSNSVSFVGSTSPLLGPSTYTTSAINMSGSAIGPAILSTFLAQLSTASGIIGFASGSAATLNVNAGTFAVTGSTAADLLVGSEGTGTLNVNAAAQVSLTGVNGHVVLGKAAGVTGTANVTGAGATMMNANDSVNAGISVGGFGTGVFNITAGGQVSDFRGLIAANAGSAGTATVSGAGSVWTNREELIVGALGSGMLTITGGGRVFDNSSIIGANPSASGTVNVAGAGSKWNQTTNLRLGSNSSFNGDTGPGELHISAGGQVATGGDGLVGSVGSGTVTVDGNDSKWTIDGRMNIREDSSVSITSSGLVQNDTAITSGTINVSGGGSTLDTSDFLTVGFGASLLPNTLNVFGGGHVSNRVALIGDGDGYGQVIIDGTGSTWGTADQLFVGLEGKGEFFVSSSAQVTSRTAQIGVSPFSSGTVVIGGSGTKWTNSGDVVVGAAGTGTLTVSNNGVAKVDGLLSIGLHGKVEGNSQIVADMRNGGTVAPGLTSSFVQTDALGTLRLDGDFNQTVDGTLQIQLGATNFDELAIDGHATLGGTLHASLFAGFMPAVGSAFQVLTATGGISGTFDLDFPTLTSGTGGPFWILTYSNSDVVLKLVNLTPGDYNRNGVVDAADYIIWRHTLGQTGFGLRADGDGDHDVDADDYDVWRAHFGQAAGSGASAIAAVPEPATLILLILATVSPCLRQSRAA